MGSCQSFPEKHSNLPRTFAEPEVHHFVFAESHPHVVTAFTLTISSFNNGIIIKLPKYIANNGEEA